MKVHAILIALTLVEDHYPGNTFSFSRSRTLESAEWCGSLNVDASQCSHACHVYMIALSGRIIAPVLFRDWTVDRNSNIVFYSFVMLNPRDWYQLHILLSVAFCERFSPHNAACGQWRKLMVKWNMSQCEVSDTFRSTGFHALRLYSGGFKRG